MKKVIMYHYIREFNKAHPYFNFLHKKNFSKQIILFKNSLLKENESFKILLNQKTKLCCHLMMVLKIIIMHIKFYSNTDLKVFFHSILSIFKKGFFRYS